MADELLGSLENVRWHTALRTFGNNHATLVGLLVDWWISSGEHRWALESGPSFGYRSRDEGGGGQCDAILVEGESSRGVVEVEGSRHVYTIDKIGKYFAAEYQDLKSLEFGLFLAYTYTIQGRGNERKIIPLPIDELIEAGKIMTSKRYGKQLVILTLDKVWDPQKSGPRARTEYYWGRPDQILGVLIKDGREIERHSIVPKEA